MSDFTNRSMNTSSNAIKKVARLKHVGLQGPLENP